MRTEFSKKVKLAAYMRCLVNGKPHCELCDLPILGIPEFDHITPDGLGGEATLENCQVACGKCHRRKSNVEDNPKMAKADRQFKAKAGIRGPKRAWPKRRFGT
jgi:5-methylcytosine-specific restriction protein A